ncbi:MAG: hypothetical protein ACLPV8_15585 [Steroidobacteraceae bacterium]
MKRLLAAALCLSSTAMCAADDNVPAPAAGPPAQRAARPRQQAPAAPAAPAEAAGAQAAADAPKFVAEAKWLMAGYNNNEIVYTILVTNQDSRIIRCTTDMQGFYIENEKKLSISDRQVTTVFPNQPTPVGNWMDMDEKSGATYTVKCKPV